MNESAGFSGSPWSVIGRLARLNEEQQFKGSRILGKEADLEACLRRVLRPHDEAGFQSDSDRWMIDLRADLDGTLGALTLREIRLELGLSVEDLPLETVQHLCLLFSSEAFLRYLDAYLYFGIRFLARREPFQVTAASVCTDGNVRSLPLLTPPTLSGLPECQASVDALRVHQAKDQEEPVRTALLFLDHFQPAQEGSVQYELEEPTQFELWLRGLRPETTETQAIRFDQIRRGLAQWATDRSRFYLSFSHPSVVTLRTEDVAQNEGEQQRSPQGWLVTHPIAARLALSDIYWIAQLLRAEVSANATVRYKKYNWLHLLRFYALLHDQPTDAAELQKAEETLRSVFDYVCDLIQNSVELTRELERQRAMPDDYPPLLSHVRRWRAVFDEELDEIENQRRVRHFRDPSLAPDISPEVGEPTPAPAGPSVGTLLSEAAPASGVSAVPLPANGSTPAVGQAEETAGWSKRMTTGERPLNLIGLAFSGGGIRSATLNLGVLQGLQELDLLRYIDYLSTVSGGGFIGSWLVTNVRRSGYWLGRLTDWTDSIGHLRSHSNYLAPRTGILSADTWNLANSWFRNAFLIQLTGVAWLFSLLLTTILGMRVFLLLGAVETRPLSLGILSINSIPLAGVIALAAGVVTLWSILHNLQGAERVATGLREQSKWVRLLAVTPAWIGAFAMASHLWLTASANCGWAAGLHHYSEILKVAWCHWWCLLLSSGIAFAIISFRTLRWHKWHWVWIGPICTAVLYLELAGTFLLFRTWSDSKDISNGLAFVFGPALVLLAFAVCILLLIGFTGRNTGEGLREWWTRFGTWLAIFGGIGLVLSAVSVLAPGLTLTFVKMSERNHWLNKIKWTTILGWIGTVIGGLFAGKSSKTDGERSENNSAALEFCAKAGGLLFIIGAFILGSTVLFILLFEIFGPNCPFTDAHVVRFFCELAWWKILVPLGGIIFLSWIFSRFFEINIFGLNQFYRNRLVRCYLGATRWTPGARKPNPFTKFDFDDDLDLSRFRTDSGGLRTSPDGDSTECGPYRGPMPVINCTLNLGGSSDLSLNTRHSASFTLTPLRCGSDRPRVGYAPTWTPADGSFAHGVRLGQAVSISGAAVSSNMGYNTSPLVAFLLTMFNLRLGWWFPNPAKDSWNARGLNSSFRYLLTELLGVADEKRAYLNISDGGHFENLAIYELIRRRCRLIIACDAECDEKLQFGGLGNLIRICETDFGAIIDLDVKSIRLGSDGRSLAHCAVGIIKYSSGEIGRLIYLKASMTGDEGVGIAQYRSSHPSFPHEATANQFFTEAQFESYRMLGLHMVRSSFKGNVPGDDPLMIAEKMADVLTPAGCASEAFLKHSAALEQIWEKFRASPSLLSFMDELISLGSKLVPPSISPDELCIGLELIQLMEDVFLDLRLDDFWDHPDNRGWAILFMRWARSPRFRMIWNKTHRTFGIRFEYFCHARLGLNRDQPIVRV